MAVKIKSPFCQGIESASSPGLYSLDVQYFTRTVFPRELGPGGTVFPKGIQSAGPKIGPDRIPYDTGRTMTVHVCGPIGNGRGSEARLVARFHTLIIRLQTPYELFGSSNNTVRLSTWPRTVCLDRLPGLVLIVYLLCTSFQPTPYVSMVEQAACRSTPYILTPRLARK